MAERKTRGSGDDAEGPAPETPIPTVRAKRRRKKKVDVIDVGERPADDAGNKADDDADEDGADKAEVLEGADIDLASAAAPLDVDAIAEVAEVAEVIDDEAEAAVPSGRGGSLAKRDPMAVYMRETRRYPLLTPDEEHALATRLVEHGDNKAARRLIEANLRLVVKIAYEYRRAHKNLLDLVQEGNVGLIQAVSKFDPYRGVKLSSYAAFWIRAYILKFILNNWRLVKIGTTQAQRKLFFNLRKEREKLEQLGFQPTTALLAEKLEVPEKEVIEMERRLAAPEASLDAPLGSGNDDDGTRTRLDYLPSDDIRPDRAVAQIEFSELLRGKLEAFAQTLEGREQTIFRERWLTEEPLTLQELGDRYQVSRERARQLEKRMLDRLKKFLEAELGTSVDIGALSRE
ncbi:MAG TPA: RNA polymerase factor sigma-32 [Kofleriaceae bacterium]|jgi:RNA polymerase sigma-32 factor|nr:RNA polymerase factor sigma-32 [Kofleriaceae bacterium]